MFITNAISRTTVLGLAAATMLCTAAMAQDRVILNAVTAQEPGVLAAGIQTIDGSQTITGGKILQPLLRYDENGDLEGILAESWTVSDDGKTYTFNLRQGVKWHDGAPFTSEDVVFTLDEILRLTHGRTRSALEYVDTMEATDEHTVVITLEQPYSPFLTAINSVNAPILPKHLYEGTDIRQNPVNNAPVGTGPFKFNEWRRGEFVHLVRNDDYWVDGQPHVDEIYFQFIPDSAQRAIAMETGRIDVATRQVISPQDIRRLVSANQAKRLPAEAYGGLGAASFLVPNHTKPPFDNVLARQAVLHALDRQLIIDAAFLGEGKVQVGPLASTTRYFDDEATAKYPYDPEKAKELLDEAGFPAGSGGTRFSIELIVANANSERQRMMEIIKQQLAEVGVEVTLRAVDVPTLQTAGTSGEYDLMFLTQGQFQHPSIGVARAYLSDRITGAWGQNMAGYSNPVIDEAWATADTALDDAIIQEAYSTIQREATEDAAYIWLFEVQDNLVVAPNVDNLYQGPLSAYYSWAEVTKE